MNQVSPYQQPGIVRICCVSHLESETVSREREREGGRRGEREMGKVHSSKQGKAVLFGFKNEP